MSTTTLKKAAKRKAAAEPYLSEAANCIRDAKEKRFAYLAVTRYHLRERASQFITQSNQLLKGKTNV